MYPGAVLLALCASGLASGMRLMSKTVSLHPSVKALNIPNDDHLITLSINLKLNNIEQLPYHLKSISDPNSPSYGNYLDKDGINALFGPSDESRTAVLTWLKSAGVTDVADFGDYINFGTTISKANTMLGSFFQNFDVDGVKKLRTLEYSVPDEVADHIELVSPTTFFGRTKAHAITPPAPKHIRKSPRPYPRQFRNTTLNCARIIEPGCLEKMYNYGSYKESRTSGSRVGFGSFLNQSAIQRDLTAYQKAYGLPLNNFSVVLINGAVDYQFRPMPAAFTEANLDSQFLSAVVGTLPMTEFITAGKP
jgi:tripeptidyl-peptidase-1